MTPKSETIELKSVGCTECYWKIQKNLERMAGFVEMTYDPFQTRIEVTYDPGQLSRDRIERAIEKMGYRIKGKSYPYESPWEALKEAFRRRCRSSRSG